ncbi:MAG TPA: hypothetical protein VHA33_12005 [Candidatus Angelobacter sp.]|jgi:hypothetical protein|nr:hypothetical protein [Candidatus Angelobacter sp.]
MFETLSDALCTRLRLAVKLFWRDPSQQCLGALVSGIEFGDQSNGPRRRGYARL